jgi:lipid II isoglutaminyl synthase (glutamine-hydrolysing)
MLDSLAGRGGVSPATRAVPSVSSQTTDLRQSLALRARVALAVGRVAKRLSQRLGRGEGGVIGGNIALRLDPHVLDVLAVGRDIAFVSGTNGKSTTAQFLAAALATAGPLAHNYGGSNMATGLVAALDAARRAPRAVLEVDEAYLGPLTAAARPRSITLMNLTHELTRGVSYKREARHWRETLSRLAPGCTVIANADDPVVAWTVQPADDVIWVAGGLLAREDALVCRGCLRPLQWDDDGYHCDGCGLSRPPAPWRLDDGVIEGPAGRVPVAVSLPGRANHVNALFAAATADLYGVDGATAMAAMGEIRDVAGRYQAYDIDGRMVRLHLAKNWGSWNETLRLFAADRDAGVVCALNGMGLTGRDAATIWDTPVELLAGRRAVATGELRDDVALRLEVAGADVTAVVDPLEAIRSLPPGRVDVVCNYVTFPGLKRRLAAEAG